MKKRLCITGSTLLGTLLFFLVSCEIKIDTSGGSETNWLRACLTQEDCGDVGSCECGICTQVCESSSDCSDVRGTASCLATESAGNGSCRVAARGESNAGICVARCSSKSDCNGGAGFECISNICVAMRKSNGEDGGLTETPAIQTSLKDADASDETDANRIEDAAITDSSEDAASGGEVLTSQSPFSMLDAMRLVQCPCTTDLLEARAPDPESSTANAYGCAPPWTSCPEATANNSGSPGGLIIPYLDPGESATELEQQIANCLIFSSFYIVCISDSDCPQGGSGTAVPRCILSPFAPGENSEIRACYLDCSSERTCPTGMACVAGSNISSCMWPANRDVAGCPSYCDRDPIPRGCPNWCASALVACAPDSGVNCCDGLVCSSEGYCVQE